MSHSGTMPKDPTLGDKSQHNLSIPLYLILTILTCGLFNIYWNYRQMEACNDLLGKKQFEFWLWFLLSIITCGIYHIFYQYQMGSVIVQIQRNNDKATFENLPIISVIVTILGFCIVVDCIHQNEINKLVT